MQHCRSLGAPEVHVCMQVPLHLASPPTFTASGRANTDLSSCTRHSSTAEPLCDTARPANRSAYVWYKACGGCKLASAPLPCVHRMLRLATRPAPQARSRACRRMATPAPASSAPFQLLTAGGTAAPACHVRTGTALPAGPAEAGTASSSRHQQGRHPLCPAAEQSLAPWKQLGSSWAAPGRACCKGICHLARLRQAPVRTSQGTAS